MTPSKLGPLLCLVALAALVVRPARADISTATFILEWGEKSPQGGGDFQYTRSNAVHDATGDVYTIEGNLLQKFDSDGNFLRQQSLSGAGIDVNQTTGDYYISSNTVHTIEQYDQNGGFIRSWGSFGSGPSQFWAPWGVAVDSSTGNVYVADTGNSRVQIFDATGTYLSEFTSAGFKGTPGEPGGIAFDPANDWVYVTHASRDIVEKFDASGTFLDRLGIDNTEECSPGLFRWPRSVAVDSAGNLYVTPTDCEQVQVFNSAGAFLEIVQG